MKTLSLLRLFKNNQRWASEITRRQPEFFSTLARQQSPDYLWIGCSDSRVPANEIVGLLPGELFVHRNVANLVIHTDINCLSVLQYAIEILMVKHVIICGHYGCGGVKTALEDKSHGFIDNWLWHIRDIYIRRMSEFKGIADETERFNRLCELNVMTQVINVGDTTIVQDAWNKGQRITIHGWIYSISNGLLKDLGVSISSFKDLKEVQK